MEGVCFDFDLAALTFFVIFGKHTNNTCTIVNRPSYAKCGYASLGVPTSGQCYERAVTTSVGIDSSSRCRVPGMFLLLGDG